MAEHPSTYFRGLAAILLAIAVDQAFAAGVSVPSGASLSLGDGIFHLGCGDLVVAGDVQVGSGTADAIADVEISGGTLAGGSGTVSLAGDWSNAGTFNAGTGEVSIIDGCETASSIVSGDSDFYRFSVTSTNGKLLSLLAGSRQTFASRLRLEGVVGDLLHIRSTSPGQEVLFSLAPGGSQSISAVDVRDNNASGGLSLAPGTPAQHQSVDSGNNTNWFVEILEVFFSDGFESL